MSKTIELNTEAEKITEQELQELQGAVNRINGLQFEIGKIETQKHAALHAFAQANDEIILLQNKLQETYGTFDVSLTDGTITRPEEKDEE